MARNKNEDKDHLPGDTYLDVITASYYKIFCDKLFPGADFLYIRTRGKKHCFMYSPKQIFFGTPKYDSHKSLWVELDEDFLDFTVREYNDYGNLPGMNWAWHKGARYNTLLPYNIYRAYMYLESILVIQWNGTLREKIENCAVPVESNTVT